MSYKVKTEFLWFKVGNIISDEEIDKNKNWIPYLDKIEDEVPAPVEAPKLEGDLNNDGVEDEKDRSIAAKVMGRGRRKKRR